MARQIGGCQWSAWAKAARISMILKGMTIEDVATEIGSSYAQVCKVLQESTIPESFTVTNDHSTVREKVCDLLCIKHVCLQTDTVKQIMDTKMLDMM